MGNLSWLQASGEARVRGRSGWCTGRPTTSVLRAPGARAARMQAGRVCAAAGGGKATAASGVGDLPRAGGSGGEAGGRAQPRLILDGRRSRLDCSKAHGGTEAALGPCLQLSWAASSGSAGRALVRHGGGEGRVLCSLLTAQALGQAPVVPSSAVLEAPATPSHAMVRLSRFSCSLAPRCRLSMRSTMSVLSLSSSSSRSRAACQSPQRASPAEHVGRPCRFPLAPRNMCSRARPTSPAY